MRNARWELSQRDDIRPVVRSGLKSVIFFALLGKNGRFSVFLGLLGEFCLGLAVGGLLLGEFCLGLAGSSPVEWCNRFVSFGVGYALSWSGGSSCPVGWGVSRDLVRMSRLR